MPNQSARRLFAPLPDLQATGVAVSAWQSLPALKGRVVASTGTVPSDEREVSDLVARAHRDAESIRHAALLQAADIESRAAEAAEQTRQDAFVNGYASGLTQARIEVADELGVRFDERCAALHDSVAAVVDGILTERDAMWAAIETEITTLALDIARKIIKTEITQNNKVIEAVVHDGLRRVADRGTVRIIVCPDDIKTIRAGKDDLLQAIDGIKNLIIDSDRRVGRGGCVIETAAGSIDSKVETQLEQVEQAMRA